MGGGTTDRVHASPGQAQSRLWRWVGRVQGRTVGTVAAIHVVAVAVWFVRHGGAAPQTVDY